MNNISSDNNNNNEFMDKKQNTPKLKRRKLYIFEKMVSESNIYCHIDELNKEKSDSVNFQGDKTQDVIVIDDDDDNGYMPSTKKKSKKDKKKKKKKNTEVINLDEYNPVIVLDSDEDKRTNTTSTTKIEGSTLLEKFLQQENNFLSDDSDITKEETKNDNFYITISDKEISEDNTININEKPNKKKNKINKIIGTPKKNTMNISEKSKKQNKINTIDNYFKKKSIEEEKINKNDIKSEKTEENTIYSDSANLYKDDGTSSDDLDLLTMDKNIENLFGIKEKKLDKEKSKEIEELDLTQNSDTEGNEKRKADSPIIDTKSSNKKVKPLFDINEEIKHKDEMNELINIDFSKILDESDEEFENKKLDDDQSSISNIFEEEGKGILTKKETKELKEFMDIDQKKFSTIIVNLFPDFQKEFNNWHDEVSNNNTDTNTRYLRNKKEKKDKNLYEICLGGII